MQARWKGHPAHHTNSQCLAEPHPPSPRPRNSQTVREHAGPPAGAGAHCPWPGYFVLYGQTPPTPGLDAFYRRNSFEVPNVKAGMDL
jgi:hypothetical protein